jgi:tetratricopeptide (TPR) repeat protein
MGILDIFKTQSPQQKLSTFLEKANWAVKEDKHNDAISYYKEAILQLQSIDSENIDLAVNLHYLLADSYRLTGQTKNAETEIIKAYKIDNNNESTLLSYGWIKLELNEYEEAIDLLNRCINLNPEKSEGYFYRGVCYAELGKLNLALEDFTKNLDIETESEEGFFNVGKTYERLKKYLKAIEFYDKAIAMEPLYSDAYISRGNCRIELGQKEKACEDYHQALELGDERVKENINEYCKN